MVKNIFKQLTTFILLTTLLSSFFYFLMFLHGTIQSKWSLSMLELMWCPALAAIITQLIYDKKITTKIFKTTQFKYYAFSYCIPLLYLFLIYFIIWSTGLGGFLNQKFLTIVAQRYHVIWINPLLFHILFSSTIGIGIKSVFTLGEEWGWRGFLLPKLLQLTSPTKAAFFSGVIWAIWHYPMIIFLDYNGHTPTYFSILCFTIMILGLSFLYTWTWIQTKSIWTVVLLHASHNLFIQQIFNPLTFNTGFTNYFIGEFGIGVEIVGILLIVIFYRLLQDMTINSNNTH